MGTLRASLFYLGLSLFTIALVIPVPLLVVAPYGVRHRYLGLWSRFALWWLRLTCGIRYRVEGLEHLPDRPAVVLAKHQSAWETIAFQQFLPAQTWVLKRELLWIPFFGWGLAMTKPVAIDRKAGKQALRQVVAQGTQRLQQGLWMIVFPEGTRMAAGQRGRYAVGGGMLAEKAAVPVVPIAHNAGSFWPRQGFAKRSGIVRVVIGPPIDTSGKSAAAITREAEAWIESQMPALEAMN